MDMVIFRNMVDPISTKFYHMFDNLITPAQLQNFGKISSDLLPGIQTQLSNRLFLQFIILYWNFEFSFQNVLWQLRWWPYRESYKKKWNFVIRYNSTLTLRLNRYRRGLETCPQAKSPNVDALFSSLFSDASEQRVWLSAKSKILASTFGSFRLYWLTHKRPFGR